MPLMVEPNLKTARLGGVDVPSADVLKKMHHSSYILHACDGRLSEVPVEKVLLPPDRETNPQAIQLVKGSDGTVYANLGNIICKSSDGGRGWTAHDKGSFRGVFEVLQDGTFIGLGGEGEHPNMKVVIHSSVDEGRTWRKIGEVPNPPGHWGGGSWIFRLPDETLLAAIGHVNHAFEQEGTKLVYKSGGGDLFVYRSTDGGQTWTDPVRVHDWASEGGVTLTPSGKLVAAHRYQRPMLPGDPADLEQRTSSANPGWPYKHVCVVESDDWGRTWKDFRLLTTVFGQTRGDPVGLSDGTVVVVHDTRYGPGPPGSRAMISCDEGRTWEDEVYYLDYTTFTGSYAGSVTLADDCILSVVGSSQAGNSWEAVRNNTDFYAIRWRPVEKSKA